MRFNWTAKIAVSVGAVLLAGFLISWFRLSSADVPGIFQEGRMQGAIIADSIVGLSNDISADLSKVNQLDLDGNPREALNLTTAIRLKVIDLRLEANSLSEEVKKMISGLNDISSPEVKQAALEAITNRLAIISRLISYSEYLDQLSEVLTHHFRGTPDNRQVSTIIAQINAEVTAINNFNRQAAEAMERFDTALKNQ